MVHGWVYTIDILRDLCAHPRPAFPLEDPLPLSAIVASSSKGWAASTVPSFSQLTYARFIHQLVPFVLILRKTQLFYIQVSVDGALFSFLSWLSGSTTVSIVPGDA